MNRTIKLQLLNLKKAYYYSAVTTYGVIILFWVIALLFDGPEFVSNMTTHPTWLSVLTFLLSPFTLMGFLYPVFDGLMFFDTALRFGVSRRNYFMGSVLIYVFLTINIAYLSLRNMWALNLSTIALRDQLQKHR